MTRFGGLIAAAFLIVAGVVGVWSFYAIGSRVSSSVILTEYAIALKPGEQRAIGYGGESAGDRADILFQGREMNDVAFVLAHTQPGQFSVTPVGGALDELVVGSHRLGVFLARKTFRAGESATVTSGEHVLTKGVLGRAGFELQFESPETVRLRLDTPVSRPLTGSVSRLTLGTEYRQPTPTPVSEIVFRTRVPEQTFRVWDDPNCGLRVEPDRDWASAGAPGGASVCYGMGERWEVGGLRLALRRYGGDVANVPGSWNRVQLFGIRLILSVALAGLALALAPSVKLRFGFLLFSAVAFVSVVALTLQARDYFLEPYLPRFRSNLQLFYWAIVALLGLRIPLNSVTRDRSFWTRIIISIGLLVVARNVTGDPFDGSPYDLIPNVGTVLWQIGQVCVVLVIANIALGILDLALTWWTGSAQAMRRYVIGTLAIGGVALLLIVVMLLAGGTEAITFTSFRIYLPALLLPFLALGGSCLLWRAEIESDPATRTTMTVLTVVGTLVPIAVYRLVSDDNGGTVVLLIGLLALAWLIVGGRRLAWLAVGTAGALAIVGALAYFSMSERFELAWSEELGSVLHYDAARNLRTARDMARAGGALGQNVNLSIPTVVRSNIHNDLVTAYLTGYFGWIGLAGVLIALFAIYNIIIGGLRERAVDLQQALGGAADAREALIACAIAIAAAVAVQSVWVAAAGLQSAVPLTGQDLPPLSASAISVVTFFGGVLGTAAATHNLTR